MGGLGWVNKLAWTQSLRSLPPFPLPLPPYLCGDEGAQGKRDLVGVHHHHLLLPRRCLGLLLLRRRWRRSVFRRIVQGRRRGREGGREGGRKGEGEAVNEWETFFLKEIHGEGREGGREGGRKEIRQGMRTFLCLQRGQQALLQVGGDGGVGQDSDTRGGEVLREGGREGERWVGVYDRVGMREERREKGKSYLLDVLPQLLPVYEQDCLLVGHHAVGVDYRVVLNVTPTDIVEPGNLVQRREEKGGGRLKGGREGGRDGRKVGVL